MKKTYIIISVLIVVVALAGLYWFGGKVTTQNNTVVLSDDGTAKLKVGQSVKFGDGMITFERVVEDSRCPKDRLCEVPGRVIAEFSIEQVNQDGTPLLQAKKILLRDPPIYQKKSPDSTEYEYVYETYGDYQFSIDVFNPEYPKHDVDKGEEINQKDYVVTLSINKTK